MSSTIATTTRRVLAGVRDLGIRQEHQQGDGGGERHVQLQLHRGLCGLAAVSPKSGCVVLSTRGIGEEYVGGSGSTLPKAMSDAQKKLYGSQVKNYMCS